MINEPLGLPKGSIRGILVLLIAIAAIVGIYIKADQVQLLITLLTGVTSFYFGGRSDWNKPEPTEGDK